MSEKVVGGVFVIRQEFGGGVIVNDDAEQQDKLKRAISQTQADERERIIKLLEPLGECEPSICGKGCRGEHRCIGWAYRHAIRLIKGENK